jgi:hypothetical protein
LKEASESVGRIRESSSEAAADGPREEGFNQVVQLAVRVIATLGSMDSRCESLGKRLAEIQAKARGAKIKATRWIRMTAIGVTLLIGWLAAGQGALCVFGWKGLRRP